MPSNRRDQALSDWLLGELWVTPDRSALQKAHQIYTCEDEARWPGLRDTQVTIQSLAGLSFEETGLEAIERFDDLIGEADQRIHELERKFDISLPLESQEDLRLVGSPDYASEAFSIVAITIFSIAFTQPFDDANKGLSSHIANHQIDMFFGPAKYPQYMKDFNKIPASKVSTKGIKGPDGWHSVWGRVMKDQWDNRRHSMGPTISLVLSQCRDFYQPEMAYKDSDLNPLPIGDLLTRLEGSS
ncbi:MAG: hypothetical protein AAF236_08180 [Verrucomicrobiota bacterium]